MFDKDLPDSIRMGQRLTTMTSGQARFPIAPSKYKFAQHGGSGMWISELLPWTAKLADEIALVKTVWTEAINHDPAVTYICTGHQLPGRPSLGAWLSYGLGTMNQNLPAFVVMTASWSSKSRRPGDLQPALGLGLLCRPGTRASALRSTGDPVLFLSNPPGVDAPTRKRTLDAIVRLNQREFEQIADPETHTRIAQYEMAFRMQTSVPELTDISNEPKSVLDLYGPDVHTPGSVRTLLPAGPPPGRARRAVRPDLSPRLGPARQPGRRPAAAVQATSTRRPMPSSPTSSSAGCSTTRW